MTNNRIPPQDLVLSSRQRKELSGILSIEVDARVLDSLERVFNEAYRRQVMADSVNAKGSNVKRFQTLSESFKSVKAALRGMDADDYTKHVDDLYSSPGHYTKLWTEDELEGFEVPVSDTYLRDLSTRNQAGISIFTDRMLCILETYIESLDPTPKGRPQQANEYALSIKYIYKEFRVMFPRGGLSCDEGTRLYQLIRFFLIEFAGYEGKSKDPSSWNPVRIIKAALDIN